LDAHGPKPSDFGPQPRRSSAPPRSAEGEDLALPVHKTSWLVIGLVLAALAAAIAAAVKMTSS
jgi:hypothetical protein